MWHKFPSSQIIMEVYCNYICRINLFSPWRCLKTPIPLKKKKKALFISLPKNWWPIAVASNENKTKQNKLEKEVMRREWVEETCRTPTRGSQLSLKGGVFWAAAAMWFFFFLVILFPVAAACTTLSSRTGMEPVPPAIEASSPNHWTIRKSLELPSWMWEALAGPHKI